MIFRLLKRDLSLTMGITRRKVNLSARPVDGVRTLTGHRTGAWLPKAFAPVRFFYRAFRPPRHFSHLQPFGLMCSSRYSSP
jgi:hypothetical protein